MGDDSTWMDQEPNDWVLLAILIGALVSIGVAYSLMGGAAYT